MILRYQNFRLPIQKLFDLANSSLNPPNFKSICEEFAKFDKAGSTENYWRFELYEKIVLLVGINGNNSGDSQDNKPKVNTAVLSFCWWDSFLKSDHETIDLYNRDRLLFNQLFIEFLEETKIVIGKPLLEGNDDDEMGHKYAIWRGKSCILILQQSAYDLQFGLDINYWIQAWSGPDPKPTKPLIEWLYNL
jgi:hypothetical protein